MDAAFARAAALLEGEGDTARLAGAHAARARWLHTTLCFPNESRAAGDRALELLRRSGADAPEVHLLALASTAWAESFAGDPVLAEALVAEAAAVPEAAGDRALAAELENVRATALVRAGRFAEAVDRSLAAAEMAHDAGLPEEAALGILTAAAASACLGDFERVVTVCEGAASWPWPGRGLEAQLGAASAHALARLGRHGEARALAEANAELVAIAGDEREVAVADFDLGSILLQAGSYEPAARHLAAALAVETSRIPRALARLRLAEALVRGGDPERAADAVARVPFETVRSADAPEVLPARLSSIQALIAVARGDHALAEARFEEAELSWGRRASAPRGEAYAAILVDLGRPPVAGLVDLDAELARVREDRAALLPAGVEEAGAP
jgi:tetratricopeptide (TPR) repeat protein